MSPTFQADFARALRTNTSYCPDLSSRFAIHRNNSLGAIIESLAATYTATQRLVGEEFFRAMAWDFILVHPPRSPVLLEYGKELPAFIDAFEPAAALPYLGDVSRIEWAWMHAYHAENAQPLKAAVLSTLDDDEISSLTITLHPSLTLLSSVYPAATIWQMNTDRDVLGDPESWQGEDTLVARPDLNVIVRTVPTHTRAFLTALDGGASIREAVEVAKNFAPGFALAEQLAGAFALSLIVKTSQSNPREKDL